MFQAQPYDFARSKGWKFAFTHYYYYCSFIRSENSAKNELQSFSLGVMKFKGPTGRLFCNDLLHDEKLPLKCKKFPVSCHHFFTNPSIDKIIHYLFCVLCTLNWNLTRQSKAVKIIMHLNAIWIVSRILFENNFPFFIFSPLAIQYLVIRLFFWRVTNCCKVLEN